MPMPIMTPYISGSAGRPQQANNTQISIHKPPISVINQPNTSQRCRLSLRVVEVDGEGEGGCRDESEVEPFIVHQ